MAEQEIGANNGQGPDPARLARGEPPPKAKRFYSEVTVVQVDGHHRVLLDNRPVKTPLYRFLETPSLPLAESIATEWRGQGTEIDPATMPLTRLAATALDRVGPERAAITDALLAYVDTDLLCYRASAPADLKSRQRILWQPILDWLAATHGVVLTVTEGIIPVAQPPAAVAAAFAVVSQLPVDRLTALQAAIGATGSFALGLALTQGRITAAEAVAAAHLDEAYQNEQWGEDAEALNRRQRIAAEVEAVGRYLSLLNS